MTFSDSFRSVLLGSRKMIVKDGLKPLLIY